MDRKNELIMISSYTRIRTMYSEASSVMNALQDLAANVQDKEAAADIECIKERVRRAYLELQDAIDDIENLVE